MQKHRTKPKPSIRKLLIPFIEHNMSYMMIFKRSSVQGSQAPLERKERAIYLLERGGGGGGRTEGRRGDRNTQTETIAFKVQAAESIGSNWYITDISDFVILNFWRKRWGERERNSFNSATQSHGDFSKQILGIVKGQKNNNENKSLEVKPLFPGEKSWEVTGAEAQWCPGWKESKRLGKPRL